MRAKRGQAVVWVSQAIAFCGDDCLEWPFAKYPDGYGAVRLNGKTCGVHRLVCIAAYGPSPSTEHQVAHSCGNSLCCNPKHLRWATRLENANDKHRHGTTVRGEKSPFSKLTSRDVAAIRMDPRPVAAIASDFGVSGPHVWNIKRRQKWAWLSAGVSQ